MQGKRKINKGHPKYPEYVEKCRALFNMYQKLMDAEDAKYPPSMFRGQDSPSSVANRKLGLECNAKFRKIKDEYSFLFEEITNA